MRLRLGHNEGGLIVIPLSRLNEKEFYVNPHLIEFIEEAPDTVITLTTGKKIVVAEPAQEVVRKIIEYRLAITAQLPQIKTRQ